jgi:AcrR family transcriptional regulator
MARHKTEERDKVVSETRQRLLEAATQEFAREGYIGANIDSISKAAGFAKGTIYNYFASKRALMLALIEEIAAYHLDYITVRVLEEDDPARRLERFFEAGFAYVTENLAAGTVMINNIYGPDTEFKEAMFAAYRPMFDLVGRDIIAAGMQQGIFRPVDPAITAGLLMNIYLGTASPTNKEGKPWIAPAQVAEFVLHALLEKEP